LLLLLFLLLASCMIGQSRTFSHDTIGGSSYHTRTVIKCKYLWTMLQMQMLGCLLR
jgi:hypothetical protein